MGGADVSVYFSGKGKMVPGIQRVNVDFTKMEIGKPLDIVSFGWKDLSSKLVPPAPW